MDIIPPDATGRYAVRTESATYLLDLDAGTLTRRPRTAVEDGPVLVAHLRKDGAAVPLLGIVGCRVGQPMSVLIEVADAPDVVTLRQTTLVRDIERLS